MSRVGIPRKVLFLSTLILLIFLCIDLFYSPKLSNVVSFGNITQSSKPLFQPMDADGKVFVVSAFVSNQANTVRISLLKHVDFYLRIVCHIQPNPTNSTKTFVTIATSLWENHIYGGEYRGFLAFCKIPEDIQPGGLLQLSALADDKRFRPVQLKILPGLPSQYPWAQGPHTFGLCLSPIFNPHRYSQDFLIEFIELNRFLGMTFMAVYLAEPPTPQMAQTFASYRNTTRTTLEKPFLLEIVEWKLPLPNASMQTWYFEQTLSQNDCIHRFGAKVKYLLNADLDEILLPSRRIKKHLPLPTWHSLLPSLEFATKWSLSICFPSKFLPWSKNAKDPVFARVMATVLTYSERRKCFLKPGLVTEAYVHNPILIGRYRIAPELAILYHYRKCLEVGYKPCAANTHYRLDFKMQPYRKAVETEVLRRLVSLQN